MGIVKILVALSRLLLRIRIRRRLGLEGRFGEWWLLGGAFSYAGEYGEEAVGCYDY